MALPTVTKTYQFDLNNVVPGVGGAGTDGTPERKQLLYEIVTSMLNGGTFTAPWTHLASSDSTAVSVVPGTNLWTAPADLVWVQGTSARSWIVIEQTAIGMQLLIDLSSAATSLEGSTFNCWMSKDGFDLTGVSTTVRPTAPDECQLRNGFDNGDGSWGSGSDANLARQFVWNVTASTDGEVWNVVIFYSGFNVGFWRFEKPENPPTGWTAPFIAQMLGDDVDVDINIAELTGQFATNLETHIVALDNVRRPTTSNQYTLATNADSNNTAVRPFTWGWGSLASSTNNQGNNLITQTHSITGNPTMWPIWWGTTANSMKGRLGRPVDLWIRQSVVGGGTGDTIPAAQPDFLIVNGDQNGYIIPWDGVTIPQTS